MSTDRPMISIVSPVFDEEAGIEEFHRRLGASIEGLAADLDFEIVYVNDGSVDRSLELLREIVADDDRVRVVDLSRNFGHQVALSAGVDHAHGDAVVVIDSDLQDPPEVIPEMIERWRKGFKVVYGVRVSRSGETRFKLLTSKLYYGLIDRVSEVPLPRQAGDFRLLDRRRARSDARAQSLRARHGRVGRVPAVRGGVRARRPLRGRHEVHGVAHDPARARRDHELLRPAAAPRHRARCGRHHALLRVRFVDHPREHHRPVGRQPRLAVAHGGRALPRRRAVALRRRARRVRGTGVPGDEGPSALRREHRDRPAGPRGPPMTPNRRRQTSYNEVYRRKLRGVTVP